MCTSHHADNVLIMSVYINHFRNYIHEHVTVCASNDNYVAKTCALPKLQVVVTIYTWW